MSVEVLAVGAFGIIIAIIIVVAVKSFFWLMKKIFKTKVIPIEMKREIDKTTNYLNGESQKYLR